VGPRRRHSLRPPRRHPHRRYTPNLFGPIPAAATHSTLADRERCARLRGIRPVGSPHQPSPDPVWEQSRRRHHLDAEAFPPKHAAARPAYPDWARPPYVAAKARGSCLPAARRRGGPPWGPRQQPGVPHTVLTEQIQQRAPAEWLQKMAAAVQLGQLGTPRERRDGRAFPHV
jgi:hypothetical protein